MKISDLPESQFLNFLAELENTLDEGFRARRTAWDIHINRDNRIHSLDGIIAIVELAA
jgi:hypothetical protein